MCRCTKNIHDFLLHNIYIIELIWSKHMIYSKSMIFQLVQECYEMRRSSVRSYKAWIIPPVQDQYPPANHQKSQHWGRGQGNTPYLACPWASYCSQPATDFTLLSTCVQLSRLSKLSLHASTAQHFKSSTQPSQKIITHGRINLTINYIERGCKNENPSPRPLIQK